MTYKKIVYKKLSKAKVDEDDSATLSDLLWVFHLLFTWASSIYGVYYFLKYTLLDYFDHVHLFFSGEYNRDFLGLLVCAISFPLFILFSYLKHEKKVL